MSSVRLLVQAIARRSFEPSPLGENDRAAIAPGPVPVLTPGPGVAPKLTPTRVAATVVLFGAGIATMFEEPLPLAAIQAFVRTYPAGCHSVSGPFTWYQMNPSTLDGPPVIAKTSPIDAEPSLVAAVPGADRTLSWDDVTRPKPPVASVGVATETLVTFQPERFPTPSRARTRNA